MRLDASVGSSHDIGLNAAHGTLQGKHTCSMRVEAVLRRKPGVIGSEWRRALRATVYALLHIVLRVFRAARCMGAQIIDVGGR